MCGHYGSDNLLKINVYFWSQIMMEKKIYCEYKGYISNFLNNSLNDSSSMCTALVQCSSYCITYCIS